MDGEIVAQGQHIVFLVDMDDLARELPGVVDGDVGIVAQNAHLEIGRGVGHQAAHAAQTDHAQRLALQLRADELALALFDQLGDRRALSLERFRPFYAAHDVARGQQQRGDGQLLDGVGVRARRVEHDDAAPAVILDGDVVVARAGAADGQQRLGHRQIVHGGAAHDDRVGIFNILADCEFVRGKHVFVDRGNFVERFDIKHGSQTPS